MYCAIQNWPKLFLSMWDLVLNSLNTLNQLLKFNDDFKYFIHVGRVLKQGIKIPVPLSLIF